MNAFRLCATGLKMKIAFPKLLKIWRFPTKLWRKWRPHGRQGWILHVEFQNKLWATHKDDGRRCRLFPCRASSSISNGTAWQARLIQIVVYHCPYISFYRTATKNHALLNQWGTSAFNLLNFLFFNQKQRMNLTWGLTPIKRYTLIAVTNAENIFHRNWKQQM